MQPKVCNFAHPKRPRNVPYSLCYHARSSKASVLDGNSSIFDMSRKTMCTCYSIAYSCKNTANPLTAFLARKLCCTRDQTQ